MATLTTRQCAAVLKALADGTRLRLLEALLTGDKCVHELTALLGCPQPHVSHHLRILRDSGLVEGIREGRQVCYRIVQPIRRALTDRQGQALDFGCCELRFPQTALARIGRFA